MGIGSIQKLESLDNFKGVPHLQPEISMFYALSQNHQHFCEKYM